MSLRFRRSIRIAPGIPLNLGLHGAWLSAGIHAVHYSRAPANPPRDDVGRSEHKYMTNRIGNTGRRDFLRMMGLGATALALSNTGLGAATAKPLRGLFPIGFTPFTPDDKIDLDGLAAQVKFCNRGSVHGLMWPQNASGWSTMSEKERLDGAEAILSSGKGGKTALVIGVQGTDLDTVTRYAQHAEKLGADAIVSLPPTGVSDDKAILAYYQKVGSITSLPFFAQAVGNISVDLLVEMFKTIPSFRYVKDETGNPLERVAELREEDRRSVEGILRRRSQHDDPGNGARILRCLPVRRSG